MAIEFTPDGREIPDPTPMEIPAGFRQPESLQQTISRMVAQALARGRVEDVGGDLEADLEDEMDFDIADDDAELRATRYEFVDMQEEVPRGEVERSSGNAKGKVAEGKEAVQKSSDESVKAGLASGKGRGGGGKAPSGKPPKSPTLEPYEALDGEEGGQGG